MSVKMPKTIIHQPDEITIAFHQLGSHASSMRDKNAQAIVSDPKIR